MTIGINNNPYSPIFRLVSKGMGETTLADPWPYSDDKEKIDKNLKKSLKNLVHAYAHEAENWCVEFISISNKTTIKIFQIPTFCVFLGIRFETDHFRLWVIEFRS